jgi:hypothetical protein
MRKKNHMPPVPPANRNDVFAGNDRPKQDATLKHSKPENSTEQGQTANIRQNTINAGFFHGRRVK